MQRDHEGPYERLGFDPLTLATNGRLRWDDPGMDEMGAGWELFPKGTRVRVLVSENRAQVWTKGTVVLTHHGMDPGFIRVLTDEPYEPWKHKGTQTSRWEMWVTYSTRGWLWSHIQPIDESRRHVT